MNHLSSLRQRLCHALGAFALGALPMLALAQLPSGLYGSFGQLANSTGQNASAATGQSAPASVSVMPVSVMSAGPALQVQNPIGDESRSSAPVNSAQTTAAANLQQAPQLGSNALRPRREPDAFERHVESVTGRRLSAFGAELFERPPSTFAPVDAAPVTDDYVLGVGDEVLIRAWGSIDIDYRATVDRSGAITLPRVGTFQVAGLRASDLNRTLRNNLSRLYTNFSVNVTVGRMRAIRVYAVGQALQPGAYTLSGVSTLLSAVFATGGPSATGSMRHIQLRRNGAVITELDLYQFLLSGAKNGDMRLLDGDIIVYSGVGPRVVLLGDSARQAIYELSHRNEALGNLLNYAGGISVLTDARKVQIERFENTTSASGKRIESVALNPAGMNFALQDGDFVTLLTVSPKFEQVVTLRGNVQNPLRYPYFAGMRIRDLIPNKEALITKDYYARNNILVQYENAQDRRDAEQLNRERLQQGRDSKIIDATDNLRDIEAQERQTRRLQSDISSTRISDEIRNLADDINWDYATIQRLGPDLKMGLITFDLGKAILQGDPAHNVLLQPGDVVTVFSSRGMRVAQTKQTRLVRLEGEFAAAGVYQAQEGETLRQLVIRAGGVLPSGYLYGAQFTRESARLEQQKAISDRADRMERDLQAQSASRAGAGSAQDSAGGLEAQLRIQRELLNRYRNTRANGRLVMDMPEKASVADLPDIMLEDGDALYVPARVATVHVLGAVYNENSFVHREGKGASDYIAQAGGTTDLANAQDAYVIRADGAVVRIGSNWSFSRNIVNPGDSIVVPENLDRYATTRNLRDWTQIFYQFALGVASIKVLKN